MGNAAYTEMYKKQWRAHQHIFDSNCPVNIEEYRLSDEYSICVNKYEGVLDTFNIRGSDCCFVGSDKILLFRWRSIDNNADFYKLIKHSNGKEYLICRQDLYGYSVIDIKEGWMMQFYPEISLNGEETFIWTGVEYNPATNVIAVSGCYWACPYSTHLFTFDDPMEEGQTYIDLAECFDGGYDSYSDVDFKGWENGDLSITRYNNKSNCNEEILIKQEEYLSWLADNGRRL